MVQARDTELRAKGRGVLDELQTVLDELARARTIEQWLRPRTGGLHQQRRPGTPTLGALESTKG
jgi:hypothetical protein